MKLNYFIIPLIAILTAALGSIITSQGMSWYNSIKLPSWTPPGSAIGLVWTILFILATASALIIWNKSTHNNFFWWIIGFFLLNAVLNFFWSYLFFGQHLIGYAVIEAALLALSVLVIIILSWPLSKYASLLMLPYFLWVIFATYLTYSVWILNK